MINKKLKNYLKMRFYFSVLFLFSFTILCQEDDNFCEPNTKYGENCTEECSPNCESNICYKNGSCVDCKPKKFGDLCDIDCSHNCNNSICFKNGTCEECISKKSGDLCELDCQNNCYKCDKNNNTICEICENGYYLLNFECEKCSEGCKDNTCNKENGNCECKEGYVGQKCQSKCNENCDGCNEDGTCIKCKDNKFFGNKCENSCDKCPNGNCTMDGICYNEIDKCLGEKLFGPSCNETCNNCKSCDRDGNCTECNDTFFYGKNCSEKCENCPNDGCDINGICINKTGDCKGQLYYGDNCNTKCDNNRTNCSTCNRKGECLSCKEEKSFGSDCDKSCEKCYGGTCNLDGTCKDNSKCAEKTYYGKSCENTCNDCLECNMDGVCIKCKNESYYGDKCQHNCIDKCFENKCNFTGFCENKEKCAKKYLYGEKCQQSCIDRCLDSSCKINGDCETNCSSTFYNFPSCNEKCSSNCLNSNCEDKIGKCINCQDEHFYGDFCNITVGNGDLINCSKAIQNGTKCTECKNGTTYGNKCENECSEGCQDKAEDGKSICKIEDGACEGCIDIYFGKYCTEKCSGCGEKGCDDQGYCKEFKCIEGKYGLKCDGNCDCGTNSNTLECGKFSKECLNCKFGYYGTSCEKKCDYKCKTGLCCLSEENELKSQLKINTNYKYLDVIVNDKKYVVEIDYNYGFPLTLFGLLKEGSNCSNIQTDTFNMKSEEVGSSDYDFTNYYTTGNLYKHYEIKLNGGENIVNSDIVIAYRVNCRELTNEKKISGVIGLGFFNSISNSLFFNKSNGQNILSYSLKDDNMIELSFGSVSKEQADYIDKLTSCKVIFTPNTDIQGKKMSCELNGIKSSKHSAALKLENAIITFSLAQENSLILKYENKIDNYLKEEYFNNECEKNEENGTIYYLYPDDKINKLPNFGFVFNDFFYSYEPNLFFEEKSNNGKKRFLIELSKNIDKSEFILGKKFLKDIKFTINNEEAFIYFYAQNAEYSNTFGEYNEHESFKLHMNARQLAAISLAIVVFINIISFIIYYFLKKKKMNSSNYIKIE